MDRGWPTGHADPGGSSRAPDGSITVTRSFVAGDSAWQFATLRSIYMQRSFDLSDEAEFFYNERSSYTGNRKILEIPNPDPRTGLMTAVWPVGAALIRLPMFAAADLLSRAASRFGFSVDRAGYRDLYQFLPALYSSAVGATGLLMLARALRGLFEDDDAVTATATVWLATPVVYYLTIEPLMGHSLSIGLACCLVALMLQVRGQISAGRFAVFGFLCGLLTITRYQEAVYFLLPMTLASGRWLRATLGVVGGAAPVLAVQLVTNHVWYGSPWSTGYQNVVKPAWLAADVWRHLFSPLQGIFTTQPIQLLGLAGLVWVYPTQKRLVLALYVIFVTQLYAVAAFIPGAPGASFGNRTLTSLTPAFALGWYSLRRRFPELRPVGTALVFANIVLLTLSTASGSSPVVIRRL